MQGQVARTFIRVRVELTWQRPATALSYGGLIEIWGNHLIVGQARLAQSRLMAKKYNRAEAVDFWEKLDGCEFPAVGIRGWPPAADQSHQCPARTRPGTLNKPRKQ